MADISAPPLQSVQLNNPIDTINGLLGLQRQKQALQTGQYTQQSAAANASNDTLANQQRQNVQAYLSDPNNADVDDDTRGKHLLAIGGDYGQSVNNHILEGKRLQTNLRSEVMDLNSKQRGLAVSALLPYSDAANTAPNAQIGADIDKLPDQDPALAGAATWVRKSLPMLPDPGAITPNPGETPQQTATRVAQAAQARAKIIQGELATYTGKSGVTPGVRTQGTTATPVATSDVTGSQTPTGPAYDVKQIGDAGTGQKAVISEHGGVTPIAGAANTTTAQQIGAKGSAAGVTDRVQQAQAAANNTVGAQDALSRAKAILESPQSPNTGANFESVKSLKNLMSGLGIDTQGADDMNTLTKNLARFEAQRATQSGLGGTDAARELAHNGSPSTSLDNKALLGVVRQSLATEKANAMYAAIQAKTSDPAVLAKNEADFRNIPHLIEALEYGMMRNPQEASEYLKSHNIDPKDMAASRAAIKEFGSR
jgi:hypothetical protein